VHQVAIHPEGVKIGLTHCLYNNNLVYIGQRWSVDKSFALLLLAYTRGPLLEIDLVQFNPVPGENCHFLFLKPAPGLAKEHKVLLIFLRKMNQIPSGMAS